VPGFDECVRCVVAGPASLFVRFGLIILAFAAPFGALFLGTRGVKTCKLSERTLVAFSVSTLFALLLAAIGLTTDSPARYSPLVLHEGAFEWPEGCAKREYSDGDLISITCHDYRNALRRKVVFDHGFRGLNGRTEHDYFRIGGEAVNFACNYFTQTCTVRHAEHNVFR
jgi:hypothetical protein